MTHPGLPRRPARHRDHLRRRAAQRARGRRQATRRRSASSSPAPAPRPSPPPSTTCASASGARTSSLCDRARRGLRGPRREHGPVQGALRRARPRRARSPRRSRAPTCSSGSPSRGAVTGDMIAHDGDATRSSSRWPIPTPEITARRGARARGPTRSSPPAAATIPNQVNNVLGFPFIFRGALDVRATQINEEMKMAATRALAALAKEDVPGVASRAPTASSASSSAATT